MRDRRTRHRHLRTCAALLLSLAGLLGSAACDTDGGGGPDDPSRAATPSASAPPPGPLPTEGTPLAVPVTGPVAALFNGDEAKLEQALPPDPGYEAPLTDQVLQDLREDTLKMAGVPGRLDARCEDKIVAQPERKVVCLVFYEGVEVRWPVVVETGGFTMVTYQTYTPQTGPLVRDAVYGTFWLNYQRKSDQLRCDEIPPLTSVELDRDTGFGCQYLDTSRPDVPPRWIDLPVMLSRFGVRFS